MNFNNITRVLVAAVCSGVLVLFTTGCEDHLNPVPTTFIGAEAVFETVEDAERVLLGAYSILDNHMATYVGREAILSDDTKITTTNTGVSVTLHNWLYTATDADIDPMMSSPYVMIYRTNLVLDNIDKVSGGTEAERNQIIGEALALRALAHFDLVRAFGDNYSTGSQYGVPFVTEAEVAEPARNAVQEVYSRIEADLLEAKNLMTRIFSEDLTRFSPTACDALLARLYLYMENYSKAEEYATKVIDNAGISLASADTYAQMFSLTEASGEYIFRAGVGATGVSVGGFWYSFQPPTITNQFAPTTALLDLAPSNDVRSGVLSTDQIGSNGEVIVNKYPGQPDGGLDGIGDIPIVRLSEMYLIRAEARFESGNSTGSLEDMNTLRAARISGFTPGGESGQALLDVIINQRRVELAFEGHRFFDLKRWGMAIDRTDCPNASECNLPASNFRFVLPMPNHEMLANRNMTQYPGY